MRRAIVAVIAALALGAVAGHFVPASLGSQELLQSPSADVKGGYLNSYIALLRSDLRAKKAGIVAESMMLTEKEAGAFWPIYKRYEGDLAKHYDARLLLMKDYADNYDKLTDAKAREFSHRAFALEEQRAGLRKEYFKQFEKVLPGKRLARFFMLERRLELLIDLKIAAEIPIVE